MVDDEGHVAPLGDVFNKHSFYDEKTRANSIEFMDHILKSQNCADDNTLHLAVQTMDSYYWTVKVEADKSLQEDHFITVLACLIIATKFHEAKYMDASYLSKKYTIDEMG